MTVTHSTSDSYLRDNEVAGFKSAAPAIECESDGLLDGVATFGLAGSAQIPIASAEQIDANYCLRFMRAVRGCAFATVDAQGLPAVRVIDVMLVEDGKLFFLAPRGKSFRADVMRTGQVAIVAQTTDFRMCRFRGPVVTTEDPQEQARLVDKLFEANPGMEDLYANDTRYVIQVFWIEEGEGEYFDLGQNPLVRVPYSLGKAEASEKGYVVTDCCIGCGACRAKCPRACISGEPGTLHVIDQQSCLHCGLCYETCPHRAIEKRG